MANNISPSDILCSKLEELRIKRGLSIEELSTLSGISCERLASLIAGRSHIDIREYKALCSALEISIDTLLRDPLLQPSNIGGKYIFSPEEDAQIEKLRSEADL